jgi:hypothetical protein
MRKLGLMKKSNTNNLKNDTQSTNQENTSDYRRRIVPSFPSGCCAH